MAHSELRYFPIFVIIPRLFFGKRFYDLSLELVTYGLFLELVPYAFFQNQAWSLNGGKWGSCPFRGFYGAYGMITVHPDASTFLGGNTGTSVLRIKIVFGWLVWFWVFWDSVSLCIHGCPGQHWPSTQSSSCLCLTSAGIKGMNHHTPFSLSFLIVSYKCFCLHVCIYVHQKISDVRSPRLDGLDGYEPPCGC